MKYSGSLNRNKCSTEIQLYGLLLNYSVVFIPQVNYTDWATANNLQILMPTFVDRGVSCGQHSGTPTTVHISFLDLELWNVVGYMGHPESKCRLVI
jgi:hypothetical protein